ncbi:MAG: hypothetical protein MUW51_11480 [Lactococcus lactis]|nr:hypothetical protein [Lactococcus lactis]
MSNQKLWIFLAMQLMPASGNNFQPWKVFVVKK